MRWSNSERSARSIATPKRTRSLIAARLPDRGASGLPPVEVAAGRVLDGAGHVLALGDRAEVGLPEVLDHTRGHAHRRLRVLHEVLLDRVALEPLGRAA